MHCNEVLDYSKVRYPHHRLLIFESINRINFIQSILHLLKILFQAYFSHFHDAELRKLIDPIVCVFGFSIYRKFQWPLICRQTPIDSLLQWVEHRIINLEDCVVLNHVNRVVDLWDNLRRFSCRYEPFLELFHQLDNFDGWNLLQLGLSFYLAAQLSL